MGVFHILKILQLVTNRSNHHMLLVQETKCWVENPLENLSSKYFDIFTCKKFQMDISSY